MSADDLGMTVVVSGEMVINNSLEQFSEEVRVDHYLFDLVYYPLLQQRALEGWNAQNGIACDMFIAE